MITTFFLIGLGLMALGLVGFIISGIVRLFARKGPAPQQGKEPENTTKHDDRNG